MDAEKGTMRTPISREDIEEILATEGEFQRWCRRKERERRRGAPRGSGSDRTGYVDWIGKVTVIPQDKAIYLMKRIHAGHDAEDLLARSEIDAQDAERLIRIGRRAKEELVMANIPLVFSIATRINRGDVPYPDFVQAGIDGLIVGAERFDYTRGFKFSTYASFCIRGALEEAIAKERGGSICLNRWAVGQLRHILYRQIRATELPDGGPMPTHKELAKEMGASERKVAQLERVAHVPLSLDVPISDEEDGKVTAMFVVGDDGDWDIPEEKWVSDEMRRALGCLDSTEFFITTHRFGLLGEEQMDWDAMAEALGLTSGTVHVYAGRALAKLRRYGGLDQLVEYFGIA